MNQAKSVFDQKQWFLKKSVRERRNKNCVEQHQGQDDPASDEIHDAMIQIGLDTQSSSIRNCQNAVVNQHMIGVERHDPWIASQKCRSV
jgi:hypothetical protein